MKNNAARVGELGTQGRRSNSAHLYKQPVFCGTHLMAPYWLLPRKIYQMVYHCSAISLPLSQQQNLIPCPTDWEVMNMWSTCGRVVEDGCYVEHGRCWSLVQKHMVEWHYIVLAYTDSHNPTMFTQPHIPQEPSRERNSGQHGKDWKLMHCGWLHSRGESRCLPYVHVQYIMLSRTYIMLVEHISC